MAHWRPRPLLLFASGCLVLMTALRAPADGGYQWTLPAGFPVPAVPADNPMSEAKVALGRHLFYDTRLSGNGTQSCASCHDQARAFTDGRARSVGSTGAAHPRGSMSLVNVAYAVALNWADPTMTRLEEQARTPMFGAQPIELGLDRDGRWLTAIAKDATYQRLFREAFSSHAAAASAPVDALITEARVIQAIASFERALVSARSPYDRYHFDRDERAISEAAKRGEVLFHSRPLSCFTCHGGIHFSTAMGAGMANGVDGAMSAERMRERFHNTGLYNLRGTLSYPPENTGVHQITRDPKDVGKFKPPTLRNIAVTAPYMHDGSVATLAEAIDHYAAGGRTIASGPHAGVGRDNPNKSDTLRGFTLTPGQKADLIAFLESLTDEALLRDSRFANPWRPR